MARSATKSNSGLAGLQPWLTTLLLIALVVTLPLMMGHRTPSTLTASGLVLVLGAGLTALVSMLGGLQNFSADRRRVLPLGWWLFALAMTLWVVLQVLPLSALAQALGPYPDVLWNQTESTPAQWSPNPAASLRGWSTFFALFLIAWLAGTLHSAQRDVLWLAIVAVGLLQALYGLYAHASGSDSVLGIWSRNNPDFVHGTFSNRNLFAAYLALIWPLAIAIWWRRSIGLLSRMPFELRVAASVISGAMIGAALLGSASRLGSAAGIAGLLMAFLLWTRYRAKRTRAVVFWPLLLVALAILVAATWYGLTPLAERLAVTSIEREGRLVVLSQVISQVPIQWWLTGIGLGGFEAVFKQFQPGDLTGWYDYAHNDLLQWLVEMGLVGAGLLIAVLVTLVRNFKLSSERLPLYAGLIALALVGLGDFSWHIPGTQVVLAIYLGVVLQPPHGHSRVEAHSQRAETARSEPAGPAMKPLADGVLPIQSTKGDIQ